MRCSRESFGHDLTNAPFGLMDAGVGLMGKFAVCSGESKKFRLKHQVQERRKERQDRCALDTRTKTSEVWGLELGVIQLLRTAYCVLQTAYCKLIKG
ncbi:hypothetical protein Murru_3469 [Allomuricauda ruestringensis DSM 13258]|uniref:Uncharacterized protein n=1 Tax=Allomuricauda ruestringensis (strain DSM 13258 / CIP 107369 / LMG 19739 / B1) TaxID=886377 RepID=G2PP59_ALLRU|nr:hypothetical protein [Allomuricauda ruestringensis]AEM72481.1 hypothetical protein Murru_3469 [Allomuricauda ruestringensis DSM 13258]